MQTKPRIFLPTRKPMNFSYSICYSERKTIAISVERDRSVVIRAPIGTTEAAIDRIVERKKAWIYGKLSHPQKYPEKATRAEFVSGETILYLGRKYRLEIRKGAKEGIEFEGKFVVTGTSRDRASDMFREWYKQAAKEAILPRVEVHSQKLGVTPQRVSISNSRYRWGSCTPRDNLSFNWKLVKAPIYVIDYVIVHELAHLIEANHTPRFWNIVRTQSPRHSRAKEWLKEHGGLLEVGL